MSINEVRALEEMNPISNGNEHLIALNLGKLNALKDEVWEK